VKLHLWLIQSIGAIVPRRLRADWKQEWEAELQYRELLLADWDKLNWKTKLDLLRRSLGAFWDALALQPRRLEDEMFQDLRYGTRMLLKNPGFTLVAVFTLALGIGANTAIFSIVNAVLLQPLPFSEPDRLVWVWGNIRNGGNRASVSPLDYLDYRAENTSFEHFAATFSGPASFNLTGSGDPERLQGAVATGNFFQALGVTAAMGRTFLLENEEPGRDQVVLLSHQLWQRRFGGDPSLIGKTLSLDGKSFEVIGVMPPAFRYPRGAELWTPMNFQGAEMKQRKFHFLRPVGRLKPGVTLAQAQADMDAVAGRMEAQYPESNTGWNLRMVPLREQLVGNIRPTLRVLFGAVGLVLLIACANVANLLLVRASSRQKEIAVRIALGAGRFRIVRQMLTESLMLSLTGGALGVFLAAWGVDLIVAFSGNDIPSTAQIGIDRQVLGFTLLVSLLTGILFGLVTALPATQPAKLNEALKEGGRAGGSSRNRTRNLLVVLETALAVVLLIGAGLLIRSFNRLQNVRPGFDASNVLTLRIDLPRERYNSAEKAASFWQQLHERLAALPGVEAVGTNTELPLNGQLNDIPFGVIGRPSAQQNQEFGADFRRVNHDYLRSLRIPLKEGRNFTEQEFRQGANLVVISESLASSVFPNEDPLGQRLGLALDETTPIEIIGIVGDIRDRTLAADPVPTMYLPVQGTQGTNLTIRTVGDPSSLTAAARKEVQAVDPDQPIAAVRTMEQVVAESVGAPRYRTMLLGLFALIALVLAAIGIYGVISYAVAQRTHEIGIRMALGAQPRAVSKLVIGQGIRLALVGVGAGLIGAVALTRLLAGLLFGVTATDPITFTGVAVILTVIALLACWIPARRAARVDPMIALRHE
jgi:putative ABC transport system permease protein